MAALGLSAVVIWLAPLLGGSADRPYSLLVVGLCALACWLRARRASPPLTGSFAALGLGLALGLSLLQLIPLPPALRRVVAAGSDADLRLILRGIPAAPTWLPLSVDASSTLNEAAGLGGLLCLLLALTPDTKPARSPQAPLDAWPLPPTSWPAASAVLVAAVTLAVLGGLAALGMPLPTPIAVPGQGTTRALFPAGLHNSNHMAALCGLGALLAAAQLLVPSSQRRPLPALLVALAWALCNLALLGTLSRAGILSWTVAQLALLLSVLRSRRSSDDEGGAPTLPSLRWLTLLPLALLLAWALLPDGSLGRLIERFSRRELAGALQPGSKIYAWLDALPILRGHLWLGVGHGAGENIFQHSHALSGRMRFAYLENQPLQILFDFGLLGGLPLFACLALFVRDARRAAHSLRGSVAETDADSVQRQAAWLVLAALGLHNLFDFNLAILGVSLPALTVVSRLEWRWVRLPRQTAPALALLTLLLVVWAWRSAPSHDEDGARLRRLASAPTTPSEVLIAEAETALLRHPFDSHIAAVTAARLVQRQHPAARTWLNRALLANPRDTLALRETARLLAQSGRRSEALLFLRQAVEHGDDEDRRRSLQQIAEVAVDADAALGALPSARDLDALLDVAGDQPQPRWTLIAALAGAAIRDGLPSTRSPYWLGRSALAISSPAQIESALAALLSASADPPSLLLADLLDRLADHGRLAEAQHWAGLAVQKRPVPEWLVALARIDLRLSPPNLGDARLRLSALLARPAGDLPRPLLARTHELFAELESAAGNPHAAQAHSQAAAALRREAGGAP